MLVIENDQITSFDVDGTLVIEIPNNETADLILPYGGELMYLRIHKKHVRFLRHCYLRGDHIEVWSKNGFAWAKTVVEALELQDYVHIARAKPTRHIDDKTDLESIVGGRIFMEND
jgi:hypothetical protein